MVAELPEIPQRSLSSQGVLYRPLQDIEVFVEDEGCEVFYEELLGRLIGDECRVFKVFALGGRLKVSEECARHKGNSPALYIISCR